MRRKLRTYVVPTFIVPFLLMGVTLSALALAPAASSAAQHGNAASRLVSSVRPDDSTIVAPNPNFTIPENGSLSEPTGSLTDVTDSDGSATCCTITPGAPATDGTATVNPDGSFSYVPNANFVGSDSFGFTLADTDSNTANGTVTVNVDDPAKTVTTFLTENPPAASPTTDVTFVVSVAPKGSGPAPTGTVSFTWTKTNGGGATSGPVGSGSAPVDGNSQATIVGTLPAGGPNGAMTITAVYSGDPFNASSTAQITYYVLASCSEGQWPAATNGYPNVVAGSPTGYYIGQSNGWFTVTAVNPSTTSTNFIGSIKTNGLILDLSSTKNELGDKVTLRGSTKIRFEFHDNGYLDGISFYAGCGFQITFDLNISGSPAAKNQIFLGNPTTHAKANPLVFTRG
jgi:hypothetical protein